MGSRPKWKLQESRRTGHRVTFMFLIKTTMMLKPAV